MNESWDIVVDIALLSVLIIISAVLKARIPLLKKVIIPTSMIAGFMGLIFGQELLGWIQFDIDLLGNIVYHLMAIGFIALSLKEREVNSSPAMFNSGLIIVLTYVVQGLVGFLLLLGLVVFLYPGLFPGVGLLLPLGFGQGPGQAFSIGTQWEELGLSGGGNLGLTIAGLGFIWATVVGIIFMNIIGKKEKYHHHDSDLLLKREAVLEKSAPSEIPLSDAMDKLTYQVALIGVIYLITYLTIYGLHVVLSPLGTFGATFAQLLVGFHFLIGSIYAMLFRFILNKLTEKGFHLEHSPNSFLLQRISGISFDFMIAASISAISIYALHEYAIPVLLLTTAGGLATIFFMLWIVPRVFPNEALPNIVGFFGMLTGTISTGMALVKAVDPMFQSNTTENLVMGSATAIMFGFPLLLILNIPIVGFVQNQPIMYFFTFLCLFVYFIALLSLLLYRTRKNGNA